MLLPKEAIDEYKVLYKERFGVDLSDDEASFRANHLVDFYRAVRGDEEQDEPSEYDQN
jgi:transcriptional antiterminator